MTDISITIYRRHLKNTHLNKSGLPQNVWAMLMTSDEVMAMYGQQQKDDRQSAANAIAQLTAELDALRTELSKLEGPHE